MKILILTLLLALPCFAQQARVIKEYDRFEDRTKYWTARSPARDGLDVMAHFSFKGKGAGQEVQGFSLIFISTSSDWRYTKDSRLFLITDGERIELGSAIQTDRNVKSAHAEEILLYPVSYDVLEKISRAKRVDVRLGNTEFQMGAYFRESVKQLLGKVQAVKRK